MRLQRPRQHDPGFEQLAEPAHERVSACRHRRGHAAAGVDRRLHPELVLVAVKDRCVGGLAGVAGSDQFRGQRAEVDPVGQVGRERAFEARACEAVERPAPRGQDLEAFLRPQGVGAEGPDRVGGQVCFERLQLRRRHQRYEAQVLQLGVAVHRSRGFGPAIEPGRRHVGVAGHERARVGDQVLLVLDRQLQRGGDLGRAGVERLPRAARVGVGHGTRAEYRRDRAGERERRGDGRPRGLAAQAE